MIYSHMQISDSSFTNFNTTAILIYYSTATDYVENSQFANGGFKYLDGGAIRLFNPLLVLETNDKLAL